MSVQVAGATMEKAVEVPTDWDYCQGCGSVGGSCQLVGGSCQLVGWSHMG